MKITGETQIAASRQAVWQGLNDPEILRQSIPGCESLEKTGDNAFKAIVSSRIGPIAARFSGTVRLSDLDPPNGYTLTGEGAGGAAGSAKGVARVRLEDAGGGTRLVYDVDAQIAGKLAQIGSRVVEAAAKMLAGQFFERFGRAVAGEPAAERGLQPAVPAWLWIIAAIVLAAAIAGMFWMLIG